MNTPGFIPENLKAARLLLGLSQIETARRSGMQQKDISLHETKTTKELIPVRYILFLVSQGVDLNSLFREGPVRLLSKEERAKPSPTFEKLHKGNALQREMEHATRLKTRLDELNPQQWNALLRLLEKEKE